MKTIIMLVFCVLTSAALPAFAQEGHCRIDWQRLNLSPEQQQQIQTLETQWQQDYSQVQPAILEEQRRLQEDLATSRPDPLEVMALQQSIARKQEQLRASACANYLRKRQVLNTSQQHNLELQIHQVLAERRRMQAPNPQEDGSEGIQYLWKRVQTIWTRMGQ